MHRLPLRGLHPEAARRITARDDGARLRCSRWGLLVGIALGLAPLGEARAEVFLRVPRAAQVDASLARDLAGLAARLTDRAALPADAALPAMLPMHPLALAQTVCPLRPASCRGLVAAYDTEHMRILYRDTLDLRDPTDQSFLLHELVHWLQHRDRALQDEPDCPSVLAAEREAYAAQNRFLAQQRQWLRVGQVLHYTVCPAGDASVGAGTEPVVRFDAATGLISSPMPSAASAPLLGRPAAVPPGLPHSFQSTTPK